MRNISLTGFLITSLLFSACAAEESPPEEEEIDEALLAEYRSAVPSRTDLEASAPEGSTSTILGEPAFYPYSSWEIVVGINGTVGVTLGLLEMIVEQPPSYYNSATKEFVWGPYPEDVGYSAAYIREAPEDADFEYHFAFLRGATNDLATLTPIVWGGGTPDPDNEDHGVGVTLWDLTAHNEFLETHDPSFDPAEHDSGRFAALYARGPAEDDPDAEVGWVVAVFRDFVSKDDQGAEPVDLDYLYGRYDAPAHVVDFLDYEANIDVSSPKDDVTEDVGVRMAFLDEGTGRAEADAIRGSLPQGERVDAVECWDTSINQTYLLFEHMVDGSVEDSYELGQPEDCGLFDATLDSLEIPSLQDIDAELLAVLDEIATTGAPPAN